LAFLSIANSRSEKMFFKKQKQYMMFFSAKMCAHENYQKCFIEYLLNLVHISADDEILNSYRKHLMNYLEEVGDVSLASNDSIIEKLINASKDDPVDEEELVEYDRILRCMMIYWKSDGAHYKNYKKQIIGQLPSHELLFFIIEGNYENFFKHFETRIKELSEDLTKRYGAEKVDNDALESFYFDILYLAMKKNQMRIVDFILRRNVFSEMCTYIPDNIEVEEIHYFTAETLMQRRNNIVVSNFPKSWFTVEVLKKFLDSKIGSINREYSEIDLSFMEGNVS
jgi:hypothetical protein